MRHLKNLLELSLFSSVSCALAFAARMFPDFFYPVVILRLSVIAYCLYVMGCIEGNKTIVNLILVSTFIGWLGGHWDFLTLAIKYNKEAIISLIAPIIVFAIVCWILSLLSIKQGRKNKNEQTS